MAVVELDFHEPDDTLIGTLDDSQLIELEFRPALQELGAISFTVSRHLAEASSAMLAKGNLVKVRIPLVDADPIALFVLKDDASQLLDKAEQGGEHLTLTGPGGLHMLSYARLREEVYAPGQPTRGDWDDDISWNWRGRAYGAILARIIEEGQNQPGTPLSAISIDFDRIEDSNGVPWAIIAEDFTVPIGIDVLTLANRLATAGDLIMVMTPDLVLHAYQTFGRNLTGPFAADNVRFEKGVNILTELQRKTQMSRVTHLITRDMDQTYRTYVTPDAYEQAVYGFLDIAWTNDPDEVEKAALNALRASDEGSESYVFESLPGESPEEGWYLPGPAGTAGHFWIGDDVTIHTGTGQHDLNAQSVTLSAVSIVLDIAADDSTDERAARSLRIVPEVSFGVPLPAFSETSDPTSVGAPGCVCLRLCTPGFPDQVDYDLDFTGPAAETVPVYPGGTGTWPTTPGQVEAPGVVGWGGGAAGSTANSPKLPVTVGVQYRMEVELQTDCDFTMNEPMIRVRFYTAADVLISTHTLATAPAPGDETWHAHSVDLTAPATAAYMRMEPENLALCVGRYDNVRRTQLGTGPDAELPADVGLEAAVGTAKHVTRCDHVHAHGDLSPSETHHHGTAQIEGYVAGATDHGALTGLADNDHPQYQTEAEVTAQIEALRWEAVTDGEDVFVWESDDLVHEWKAY